MLHLFFGGGFALRTADQKAYAAFHGGEYVRAAEGFADPMWRGVAYFKAGDFKQAAKVFSGIRTAEGHYNHGNALMMLGKYDGAIGSYDNAISMGAGEDAKVNRAIAEARKKALDFDGGNMTDGKIGSDGITFEQGNNDPSEDAGEEVVEGGGRGR
ncbi:tol-pal system YbgF family protein [Rubritalea tangerina]|uniref:Tol-pal system YbgF family protein n=1 Tax=Rubritalea tangerina TaxID=430798 RepID=A0ABW4ZA02_9BACT